MGNQSPDKKQEEASTEKQLRQMEWELYESYRDLGKRVLEMAETEGERTNHLVDQIIETKRHLLSLRGENQCDNCGSYNGADSRYCRHCGRRINQTKTQGEEPTI